jgi:diguanylate cyclase (GGDEF)-like protein
MDFAQTAIAVQSIGTCLVAFFLWQLGRAIHVRFVTSWALAAVTFCIALGFLQITVAIGDRSWASRACFGVFMAGSYLMAFLFWSGLREYSRNEPFTLRHLARMLPLLAFAALGPGIASDFREIVPIHFAVMGGFYSTIVADLLGRRTESRRSVGRPMVLASLSVLAMLMFVRAYAAFANGAVADWKHASFAWAVAIDAVAEVLIVFGTVILACERVRDQLEANNRDLLAAKSELEQVARTDGLTGLLNRRAFEEWSTSPTVASNHGCVAVIDLNDLKRLNDTHLHAAGDAALKLVARSLQNRFRVTDPIFRIGGDEFAIIMPGGEPNELERRLGSIDDDLMNLRLPGLSEPYSLHIAWGVAAYTATCGVERAFQIADREMYAQKGRRKSLPPATR